jgi:hypothetical protein
MFRHHGRLFDPPTTIDERKTMELRRRHRIVYQTKIRLQTAGRQDGVVARVQNLSPLGVFVTASATELPRAGEEVLCRFTLAREPRTLRGRVAWVRQVSAKAPLASPGVGIEFVGLGARESELLQQLVEPLDVDRQPVDVWFDGMPAPVRCQAAIVGQEVRLATRLPFMRLHSPVRISFVQQPGGDIRHGTLDSVMLEPSDAEGVPHLRLSIATSVLDNARGTIEAKRPASTGGQVVPLIDPGVSTVVDPSVAIAPQPQWLTFATEKRGAPAERRPAEPTAIHTRVPAVPGRPRQAVARPTWIAWLGGGWRPLILGGVTGALVVSLLWSLL